MPMQIISAQALHGSVIFYVHLFVLTGVFLCSSVVSQNNTDVILFLFFLVPVHLPSRINTSRILSGRQLSLLHVPDLYRSSTDNLCMPLCITPYNFSVGIKRMLLHLFCQNVVSFLHTRNNRRTFLVLLFSGHRLLLLLLSACQ